MLCYCSENCVSFENKTTPQLSEGSTEGQSDTIFGFSDFRIFVAK